LAELKAMTKPKKKFRKLYAILLIAILVFLTFGYFFIFAFPGPVDIEIMPEKNSKQASEIITLNIYVINNNFWRISSPKTIESGFTGGLSTITIYDQLPFAAYEILSKTLIAIHYMNVTAISPSNYTFFVRFSNDNGFSSYETANFNIELTPNHEVRIEKV
jgi:hypothetical protein